MNRRIQSLTLAVAGSLALALAACQDGQPHNPFVAEKPFVATEVPADFAIIVDQDLATYYSRQHLQQVIDAQTRMSKSNYTAYRDFNNTVNNQFSLDHPLTNDQLQAMWNEVSRNDLLTGGTLWINYRSNADFYRLNLNQIQIRANGKVKTYTASNGYPPKMRTLTRLVESVRLQQPGAPAPEAPPAPATMPGATPATTQPESRPSVEDALGQPTTAPIFPPATAPDMAPTTKPSDPTE